MGGPNLQLEGLYGTQHMQPFWDDYRNRSSQQSQQQIDFDAQKSYLMNPAWHETLRRKSGQYDPRTVGRDLQAQTPEAIPQMMDYNNKFYSSTDAQVGGIDPKKGATYSGPQFTPYQRG